MSGGPYIGKKNDKIEIPMMQVQDLYKGRKSRDSSRLKAYNKLLEQIYHKIRVTSNLPTHPDNLLYTVPNFIFGLPRLDLQDCIVYLVYQLRTAGFKVHYSYPNLLNISWRHYEENYLLSDNPILNAMIATRDVAEPTYKSSPTGFGGSPMPAKKQDRKVHFDTTPTAGSPFGRSQPSTSIVPKPSYKPIDEYQPPPGFFTAIERPSTSVGAMPSAMGGVSRGGMNGGGMGSGGMGGSASSSSTTAEAAQNAFKGLWS
jgi:hypothetical protein